MTVHHVRKLANLNSPGQRERPEWMKRMAARRRKTLIVCRLCHERIHSGHYDGKALRRQDGWTAT
ncbi:MAG: hypothetical protein WA970_06410 [Gammaproteobacteria bacterium]